VCFNKLNTQETQETQQTQKTQKTQKRKNAKNAKTQKTQKRNKRKMNTVIFLVMRRMRLPLLVLLTVYTVAIVGITLIPGVDDKGNTWYMDFVHAFYFVSFMGTTIGFGEIPYEFSVAQRMWVTVSLYMTVVAWIYAIGTLLTLIQDEALQRIVTEKRFARAANYIHEPFYLVCGYGDTGHALVSALEKRFMRSVVIEIRQERIDVLTMENYPVYVPKLCADANKPIHLVQGGLKNPHCAGIVALTNDNLANLQIAITSKLIKPALTVIARVDSHEVAANMDSFGTDHLINPFNIFARKLHTALYFPNLQLLRECLAGEINITSCKPLNPPQQGLWILCGYGRFGKAVYKQFKGKKDIRLVVIEATPGMTGYPRGEYVVGPGTEADTLQQAHIEEAVGIIAGTNDDVNNLSIVMTARELKPSIFVVLRQNKADNQMIFDAAKADIVMQPSKIIANHIRLLLTTPLLINFMALAKQHHQQWTNQLIARLRNLLDNTVPNLWEITIDCKYTPAVCETILKGHSVDLECLNRDPRNRHDHLAALPLLLIRGEQSILLPEESEELEIGDQLLFCGQHWAQKWMEWTLRDPLVLIYLSTGEIVPRSYVWRFLFRNRRMSNG
jgi:voltage-gated potassium channel